MALAEADALLRQHEAMTQEYEHLKTLLAWRDKAVQVVAELTPRQHEIMELVLIGTASKNIAADLHISQRTVENHRAAIMKKTHSKGLPALGRIGFAATLHEQCCTENGSERARVP
jgi:two-component system CheB/CheR fusion protein